MPSTTEDVTAMLRELSGGETQAADRLMPLVYNELRRLADYYLSSERPDHTLQGTALVHEAYLRLVNQQEANWLNRAHFFGVAAQLMRQILVDYARRHRAQKRGAGRKLSLDEAAGFAKAEDLDLVALDEALTALAVIDPQRSRIVELKFFGGLSVEETAEVLSVSPRTVKRGWRTAKAWLHRELSQHAHPNA